MTHASIYAQAAFQQWMEHPDRAFDVQSADYDGLSECLRLFLTNYPGPIDTGMIVMWRALHHRNYVSWFPNGIHCDVFFQIVAKLLFAAAGPIRGYALLQEGMRRLPIAELRMLRAGVHVNPHSSGVFIHEPNVFIRNHDRQLIERANMEISLFDRRDISDDLRHLIGTFVSEHIGTLYTPTQMIQYGQWLHAETKRANPTHLYSHACQHRAEFEASIDQQQHGVVVIGGGTPRGAICAGTD